MRYFKFLMMAAFLTVFLAMTVTNAATYQKVGDTTTATGAVAADSVILHINSTGKDRLVTLTEIYASAANVGASTIVTVGALDAGSITSNFGAIDNGTSNITSGGLWNMDVDGTIIGAVGSFTFGASGDAALLFDGTDLVLTSTVDIAYDAGGDDHIFRSSDVVVATIDETGIDIVTNNYTTGGQFVIDVDGTNYNAAGSITFGAGNDSGEFWDGTDHVISSSADIKYQADGDDHIFQSSFVTQATIDDTGMDIITGNAYMINATSVLNATTLGGAVVTSSLTTVGALDSGSISTGFGAIDNGVSAITSGGIWSIDVDGGSGAAALGAAGALSLGAGTDFAIWFDGTDGFISSTTDLNFDAAGDDFIFSSSDTIVATIDDTGIDIVTNNFTTGGQFIIDVDGGSGAAAVGAAGSLTVGLGSDASLWWDGTDLYISSTTDMQFDAAGDDFVFSSSDVVVATIDDTGIDLVANGVRAGGIWRVDVDGTVLGAAGSLNFGAGTDDSGMLWDGSDHIITSTGGMIFGVVEASDYNFFEVLTETFRIDFSDATSATSLMLYNRADDSLIRVTVSYNDTGGTGFRALVIPNL